MCLIGASLGGAIVSMFALKYPSYVSMICLLAPPGKFNLVVSHKDLLNLANEQCETELIQQLRQGEYKSLLPETPSELQDMIDIMAVKRIHPPRILLNGFFALRLTLLEEHKKGSTKILRRSEIIVTINSSDFTSPVRLSQS